MASIAHHRAVDRLRQRFAAKRGGEQTESLEERQTDSRELTEYGVATTLDELEQRELTSMLRELLGELKPPQGKLLAEFSCMD